MEERPQRGHFLAADPRHEEVRATQGGHGGTDSFLSAALSPRAASAVRLGGLKCQSAM